MRLFNLDERYSILCETKPTKTAFKHEANLLSNGYSTGHRVKICYVNRTWERFEYESVLLKCINKFLTEKADEFKKIIDTIKY